MLGAPQASPAIPVGWHGATEKWAPLHGGTEKWDRIVQKTQDDAAYAKSQALRGLFFYASRPHISISPPTVEAPSPRFRHLPQSVPRFSQSSPALSHHFPTILGTFPTSSRDFPNLPQHFLTTSPRFRPLPQPIPRFSQSSPALSHHFPTI